ncbi:MAG: hypothetical protein Q7R76_00565 [Candidatus Woesearchaeota archaeon]|nr:hypothetical protein [Candidatus Woesearchaeota archaeon]
METVTKLKAWGNSVGILLPKEKLCQEHLAVNDEVEVIVRKKAGSLRAIFGELKKFTPTSGKSTDVLLKEIDEEFESRFD